MAAIPEFSMPIQAQPNVLSNFSSYSYTISLYMLTSAQYSALINSETKSTAGFQLLVQSAGAPTQPVATRDRAMRNKFFDRDFYLDDLEIHNYITGRGTGGAHTAYDMRFKIIEPYGITFLERLKNAVNEMAAQEGADNLTYFLQPYLLAIRFYGYDVNGNLIKGVSNTSDQSAAYEKFLPFKFKNIKFRINNNAVEYQCEAQPIWQSVALGSATGAAPNNIEISGATVKELLTGTTAATTGQSASASVRGLVDAVNKFYKDNTPAGGIPDEIAIEFSSNSGIDTSPVKKVGPITKALSTQPAPTAADAQLLPEKGAMSATERNTQIPKGVPIIKIIQQVITNSDFIAKQQTFEVTETGEVLPRASAKGASAQWFNVTGKIELKYDPVRKGYATKTTYMVTPYQIYLDSYILPKTAYRGSHKRYDYWFTGTNKEVISFEQEYNFLYYTTLPPTAGEQTVQQASNRVSARYQEAKTQEIIQGTSAGTSHGAIGGNSEPGAALSSVLYSVADQAQAKMVIHGDPQWLGEYDQSLNSLSAYSSGGSINFDSQEIIYEINFNIPTDYGSNGLMEVNSTNIGTNPRHSFLYRAIKVSSSFKDGKFTQEITGVLRMFPEAENKEPAAVSGTVKTDASREKAPLASTPADLVKQGLAKPVAVANGSPGANLTEPDSGYNSAEQQTRRADQPVAQVTAKGRHEIVKFVNGRLVTYVVTSSDQARELFEQGAITANELIQALQHV